MDKNYFVNGHVKLVDNSSNVILVDKDNLILNGGRDAIFDSLIKSGFFKISNSDGYVASSAGSTSPLAPSAKDGISYTFSEIIFGYGDDEVTLEDDYNKIKKLYYDDGDNSTDYWSFKFTDGNVQATLDNNPNTSVRELKFTISFNGVNVFAAKNSSEGTPYSTAVISELGIVLNKEESGTSTQILFSRVKFDTISIVADNSYTLTYSLYF